MDEQNRVGPGASDTALNAARSGDVARLRDALDTGLPVAARNEAGDSLLMLAAYHGHDDAVSLLLERGADPNALNARGQHPLAGACYKGYTVIASRLLDAGANPDGTTGAARSPLMYAAMYNHAQVVRLLLARGADANLRNTDGKRALDLALEMRAVHTIPLLEDR
jgi:ankyrin repeat protein